MIITILAVLASEIILTLLFFVGRSIVRDTKYYFRRKDSRKKDKFYSTIRSDIASFYLVTKNNVDLMKKHNDDDSAIQKHVQERLYFFIDEEINKYDRMMR